jgi:tetratricopeptide (TPR) repeat protein
VRCVNALALDIQYYPIKIPVSQVVELLSQAAELCRNLGPSANRDRFWAVLYQGGLLPGGMYLKEEALQIARENHFRFEESDALYHLWLDYLYKIQDFQKGAQYLEPSLAIVKDMQDVDGMAERMLGMVFLAALRGDMTQMRSLYDEAMSYHRQVNNFRSIHIWEIVLLRFSQDAEDVEQAERAIQYFEELQDIPNTLMGYVYLIQAEWSNGNRQHAERAAEHALSLSNTIDQTSFDLIFILIYASGLAIVAGNFPTGLQYLRMAGPLIPKYLPVNMESRLVFLDILSAYTVLSGDAVQGAKILGAFDSTFEKFKNLGFPWELRLHEEMIHTARLNLSEEAFHCAWETGQAMGFLQAFDSFLEEFIRSAEQRASSG